MYACACVCVRMHVHARVRDVVGRNPMMLVGTKMDLLLQVRACVCVH